MQCCVVIQVLKITVTKIHALIAFAAFKAHVLEYFTPANLQETLLRFHRNCVLLSGLLASRSGRVAFKYHWTFCNNSNNTRMSLDLPESSLKLFF